jgi:hypothetical protein
MITKWIGEAFNHKKSTSTLKIQRQIQPQMKAHDLQNRTNCPPKTMHMPKNTYKRTTAAT